MLLRNAEGKYVDVVNSSGNLDYIKNNVIHHNIEMQIVLVNSQSELSALSDYDPGSIAFTAGFANMWQKKTDGTWAAFE